MTNRTPPPAHLIGLMAGATLLAGFTGCVAEQARPPSRISRGRPVVQVQAAVTFQDDYDYYPAYEVYYSRSRREYVYRDGNAWVRRAEPRGVTVAVLFATPAVRLDFHDSPEQHHGTVVQAYLLWLDTLSAHSGRRVMGGFWFSAE